jgi:hypothetical protein
MQFHRPPNLRDVLLITDKGGRTGSAGVFAQYADRATINRLSFPTVQHDIYRRIDST